MERLLRSGQPAGAQERLDRLARRVGDSGTLRRLRQLTSHLKTAKSLARLGDFGAAAREWEAAQQLQPDLFVAMAAYGDYAPGYIGTEIAYTQGGYETSNRASRVAPAVEGVLMKAVKKLLGTE